MAAWARFIPALGFVTAFSSCSSPTSGGHDASGRVDAAHADAGRDAGMSLEAGGSEDRLVDAAGDAAQGSDTTTDAVTGDGSSEGAAGPDVAAPCGPVDDETLFVDPLDGRDDARHTGARGCPLRSLTAALGLVAAQRGPADASAKSWTLTIVNTKGPVTLGAATGESFPLTLTPDVAIDTEDPTAAPPVVALTTTDHTGVQLTGAGWRLSHLDLECNGGGFFGVNNDMGGDGALDHVTLAGCGHGLLTGRGTVTIGPGFVAHGNSWGAKVQGGTLVVLGGRGAEHTDISDNTSFGIWVHATETSEPTTALDIRGADIDPSHPDENDIAIDGNMNGIFFDIGPEAMTARGLHASGNQIGIQSISGPASLTVRASYLADNKRSALVLSQAAVSGTSMFDFGAQARPDPGHNVFAAAGQAADMNTQGAICVTALAAGAPRILAAGNVFGSDDCAFGGDVTTATTCTKQVGVAIPDVAAIDVSACSSQ